MRSFPQVRRSELDQLRQIEKKSFSSRSKYKEREYLQAVYEVYRRWPAAQRKAWAKQMAGVGNIPWRRSSHPIRIIIDCSSPTTDAKTKSRWTQALRYASTQNVMSAKLREFFMEKGKGGLAGRASELAKLRGKKVAAPKRKAAIAKKVISRKAPVK